MYRYVIAVSDNFKGGNEIYEVEVDKKDHYTVLKEFWNKFFIGSENEDATCPTTVDGIEKDFFDCDMNVSRPYFIEKVDKKT